MKKYLTAGLAAIMALALLAGCGSKDEPAAPLDIGVGSPPASNESPAGSGDRVPGISQSDGNGATGWPAADFPQGFPVYPNGEVTYTEGNASDLGLFVYVSDTDEATYNAYLKTLEAEGWKEPVWAEDSPEGVELVKGSFSLLIGFEKPDSTVNLMLTDLGDLSTNFDWPSGLPYDLPAYPDGQIFDLSVDDDYTLLAFILGTTKESFEKYVGMLTQAGWVKRVYDEELEGFATGEDEYHFDSKDDKWWMTVQLGDLEGSPCVDIYVSLKAEAGE